MTLENPKDRGWAMGKEAGSGGLKGMGKERRQEACSLGLSVLTLSKPHFFSEGCLSVCLSVRRSTLLLLVKERRQRPLYIHSIPQALSIPGHFNRVCQATRSVT